MKQKLLRNLFLLCALIVGSSAWADTKTEGFEKKSASTTYNSTVTINENQSDCGIGWSIYYGTVSTNDKISGSNSAQMRWYSSATSNYPYMITTTAVDGLSNVSLKARTSSLDVKMDISYSTDGETWTVGKTYSFTETGKGEAVSLDIPSGNQYVKFGVNSSSTAPKSGNYKLIIDDVVFTYSSSKEDATWSVDPASVSIMENELAYLQLTTNYDGTLTFTSNDEDVVVVEYNPSTKVITVLGGKAGSTTISVTGDATENFNAINKIIDVTVNHNELTYNLVDELGPLGYDYYGLTPSGSDTYVQPKDESTERTGNYGVTILWEKAEGGTYPRFDQAYTRFYQKNTLTVTAPAGSYITKIVFVEPTSGKSWSGSMTASTGNYVSDVKTWYATEENITSVVLTNDNTKRIGEIDVYLKATSLPISVTSAGYATFVSDVDLDYSAVDGLKAYKATVDGVNITFDRVTTVPAGEGVLLSAAEGTYTVPVAASAVAAWAADDNAFVRGTGEAVATDNGDGAYNYILNVVNEVPGFYQAAGNKVAKNRAYLKAAVSTARIDIALDGETTSISEECRVQSEEFATAAMYDLQGRRVEKPTKGLYIVNGKKVVVK